MTSFQQSIALFVAMVFLLFPRHAGASTSKPITCMNEIRTLQTAMRLFKAEEGQYPPQEIWEELLTGQNIGDLNKFESKFLRHAPVDPWGNKYVYRYPGRVNTDSYDLYSLGKDGISKPGGNDSDDINNWDPDHPWLYEAYGFSGPVKILVRLISVPLISILVIVGLSVVLSRRKKKSEGNI